MFIYFYLQFFFCFFVCLHDFRWFLFVGFTTEASLLLTVNISFSNSLKCVTFFLCVFFPPVLIFVSYFKTVCWLPGRPPSLTTTTCRENQHWVCLEYGWEKKCSFVCACMSCKESDLFTTRPLLIMIMDLRCFCSDLCISPAMFWTSFSGKARQFGPTVNTLKNISAFIIEQLHHVDAVRF